jgi:dipeptidyl-peptidase-4
MKSKHFSVLFFFCVSILHNKKITVEQIYNGTFRAQGMDALQSLKNTNQYTVLNMDRALEACKLMYMILLLLKNRLLLIDTKDHKGCLRLMVIHLMLLKKRCYWL